MTWSQNAIEVIPPIAALIVTGIVIYCTCKSELSLFSWHPVLMTLGFTYFPASALFAIRKKYFTTDLKERTNFAKFHALMGAIGTICIFFGFLSIFINKIRYGKPHFTSLHAWWGLVALGFFFFSLYLGVYKTYRRGRNLQWLWKSDLHRVSGNVGFAASGICLYYGFYTGWAYHNLGYMNMSICLSAVILLHGMSLLNGIYSFKKKSKTI